MSRKARGKDSGSGVSERRLLALSRAGNPILREAMPGVAREDIRSRKVQDLIANIRYTNQEKQYGVGLAAPQVGVRLSLSVIGVKPTPNRPELDVFDQVIINPQYEGIGSLVDEWEGCQSVGSGDDILYAKVPRFRRVKATWVDENGRDHEEVLEGFIAQVFQHEADHLEGVLFIDKIEDTRTIMMADEYRQRVVGRE